MTYADYGFYAAEYCGEAIESRDFPRLALRASSFLDSVTMGRAKKHPDVYELKMACCALAEQYQSIETAQRAAQKSLSVTLNSANGEVSSETVGSWSRSYRSGGDSAASVLSAVQNSHAALVDTAKIYLASTDLLKARGYMA